VRSTSRSLPHWRLTEPTANPHRSARPCDLPAGYQHPDLSDQEPTWRADKPFALHHPVLAGHERQATQRSNTDTGHASSAPGAPPHAPPLVPVQSSALAHRAQQTQHPCGYGRTCTEHPFRHLRHPRQHQHAPPNRHSPIGCDHHLGTRRGFLPRALWNTCPQSVAVRRACASDGQVSHKPKHEQPEQVKE